MCLLNLCGLRLHCAGKVKKKAVEPGYGELGAVAADGLAEEELDEDGIGGGGVAIESRPAVFGATNHAEDVQQPAWARVGLMDPALKQADQLEGAAEVAKEQQQVWMDER